MKLIPILFFLLFFFHTVAQNGSKEKIYSSFTLLNKSMEETRMEILNQVNKKYFDLIKLKGQDSIVVNAVDSLRNKSTNLVNYINHIKILLIIKTEKLDKKAVILNDTIISLDYLNHFDDYYTPSEVLLGEDEWNPIKGKYTALGLKEQLNMYISSLKKKFGETSNYISIEQQNFYGNWEVNNFFNKPLAGIICYLSKLQLDIRLSELQYIDKIETLESE